MTAGATATPAQRPGVLPDQPGDRIARRSRLASIGLVVILLGVSVFAVWSAQATSGAAHSAGLASRLSDDYDAATRAVSEAESLERKYRLEPTSDVEARYDEAAGMLVAALASIRRDGDAGDRARVERLLVAHSDYQGAVDRLFRATDRGDTAAALRIDDAEVEPAFDAIKESVGAAAQVQRDAALGELTRLQNLETITSRLMPLVFLVGLLLAAALASITRGHRRLIDVERAQAIHDSMHDALTGLPNRTLLADRFTQALRAGRRNGTATGLLLIDLDRFKDINDTFGHHCGDLLLAQVGPRLCTVLREVDTVARLGGDEFAVLLPDITDARAAIVVADKLRAALESPFYVKGYTPLGVDREGVDLDVEASIGIAVSGEHGEDVDTLLQHADIAMYVAKSQNLGVFVYDPTVDGHSPAKLALLGDLRRALERDELFLHYQPKISISAGDVVGAEALLRWQHPHRGLMPPDEFVPLAEHSGLIGPLTRFVLDNALRQARAWADAGRPLKVAVNLSARNLLDEHLTDMVAELLAAHRVPAGLLELEVTETALTTEPGRAQRLLEQLAALGVQASVDDFGAGYTSLGQLKTLPVSELKIDRSFVTTMTTDRSNALIVRSVVDLGHNLGLTIVAEGIETAEALTALAALGCDVGQGYHLCRPLPIDAFDAWYHHRARTPVHPPGAPAPPARHGTRSPSG